MAWRNGKLAGQFQLLMVYTQRISWPVWQRLLLLGILILGLAFILQRSELNQLLALGFSADFLLTFPFLYWLLIRKTRLPAITLIPFSFGMLLLARWLLPAGQQEFLALYQRWMLPLLELVVVGLVLVKVRKAAAAFTAARAGMDILQRLQGAAKQVLGSERLAAVLATELAIGYFAVRAFHRTGRQGGYSYHAQTAMPAVLGVLMLLVVVETLALHVLVMQWSVLMANILSLASLYSLLFLLGLIGAVRHRPHQFTEQGLLLRFGLQEALVPYAQIVTITSLKGEVSEKLKAQKLGMLGNYNLILTTEKPQALARLYGIRRSFTTLVFWVDEVAPFLQELAQRMEPDATEAPHTADSTRL